MLLYVTLFVTLFFHSSKGMIGFDCGSTIPNITTFSLIDSGECDFHEIKPNATNVTIELFQVAEFKSVAIKQCKIEIERTIYYCGMFGHLIPVENGKQEYLYDISNEACNLIHETGVFKYDNTHIFANLKVNSSMSHGVDFAGSAAEKSCSGVSYSDSFGSWNKVFVQGTIKITLLEINGQVNLKKNKLKLPSGTVCRFSEQTCLDMEGGYSFWKPLPSENCLGNNYELLYKGIATKFLNTAKHETIFAVNSNVVTFALLAKNAINHCNTDLITTEHPKLLIHEYKNEYPRNTIENAVSPDIFTYMNSKFIYIERRLETEVNNLYLDLITHRCELERSVIQNSLSLATLAPDEFAYNVMKGPGYMAKIAGEVVHLIKCTPKEVKVQHTNHCFLELPVSSGNETWFLKPKTHILIRKGTQVECNTIVPAYYKISEDWIKFIPSPTKTEPPHHLNPNTKITYLFNIPKGLATSGVYSQTDLDKLQENLQFQLEKGPLLNAIAMKMHGDNSIDGDSINNIFTGNTLKHIVESTWHTIVEELTSFGSISSAIIMVLIIIQFIRLLVDLVVQGYTLHALYGWSIKLLGALFSSITHLLINLNTRNYNEKSEKRNRSKQETIELQEVVIDKVSISPPLTAIPPPLPQKAPYIIPNKQKKEYQPQPHKTMSIPDLDIFSLKPCI